MKEIGSEFWKIELKEKRDNSKYFNFGRDTKYLFCGRTAISYVIDNISDNKKIVYMPDYCCDSMVEPFKNKGYQIKYYGCDIINNKYNIDVNEDCSVFYAMSYFGYSESTIDSYIKTMKDRNVIVIEDNTHRLLEKNNYCIFSDYVIASLRKWFPVYTGAIAVNLKGNFNVSLDDYAVDNEFLNLRKTAMELKQKYLFNDFDCKAEYLEKYNITNMMFENYEKKIMDEESKRILEGLDIEEIIEKRIENAKLIEGNLANLKGIELIYHLSDGDCPLFVPIIVQNRDDLKRELIENSIYCPTHWPNFNNFKNPIYNEELSVICDQRYTKGDIENIINVIKNWTEKGAIK